MSDHNNILFTLSLQNNKISLTTSHSFDANPPSYISSDKGTHRGLLIRNNSANPIPIEFDAELWFSGKAVFKAEVPSFKNISEKESRKEWGSLFKCKTTTKKSVSIKRSHIIPPFLAVSFLESTSKNPASILSTFPDTIERETDIFEKFDADELPPPIEEIIRFLYLCINKKAEEATFTETLVDDDERDEWLDKNLSIFKTTEEEIESFKDSLINIQSQPDDQIVPIADPPTPPDTNEESPVQNPTPTIPPANDNPISGLIQQQTEISSTLSKTIQDLATNSSVDPMITSIIQSLALIATNSSVAQIENAKFQQSIAKSTKDAEARAQKEQQKKEESKKSANWEKLDDSIKSLLLTASTDGVSPCEQPSDTLLKIVQAKTGPVIRLILQQKFPTLCINVDVGLCTALSRGLVLSIPSPHTINNLSPFFTPPDGAEEFSAEDFLKIDVQYKVDNGLDDKDVKMLTKQKKTIPKMPLTLFNKSKNFQKFAVKSSVLHPFSTCRIRN